MPFRLLFLLPRLLVLGLALAQNRQRDSLLAVPRQRPAADTVRVGSLANLTSLYVQTEQYQKALASGKERQRRIAQHLPAAVRH